MFWADACVHFLGEKSYHANTMSFWRDHLDWQTFCGALKTIHTKEVNHHNLCKAENGDVRWSWGPQISYSSLFSIMMMTSYRHILWIEINRMIQEVAEMSGISRYTAQHTLTSDLSMSHAKARWILLNVWNFY